MKHLALFTKESAEKILSGEKSIEIRIAKSKIAPFGAVSANDLVYIKVSGGDIIGQFRVKKVITIDGVDDEDLDEIKDKYGKELINPQIEIKDKNRCKYATIIFIGDSNRFITSPIKLPKKSLRGWVVLS
mgnify:CR=1 FL=1